MSEPLPTHTVALAAFTGPGPLPPRDAPAPLAAVLPGAGKLLPGAVVSQALDSDLLARAEAEAPTLLGGHPLSRVAAIAFPGPGLPVKQVEALLRAGELAWVYAQPRLAEPPAPPPQAQGYLRPPTQTSSMTADFFKRQWGVGLTDFTHPSDVEGAGVTLHVIERGWHRSTLAGSVAVPDLPEPPIAWGTPSSVTSERNHGTADLGILAMSRTNTEGGWGLCPAADIRLVAAPKAPSPLQAHALYSALLYCALHAPPGSVVLVEEQMDFDPSISGVVLGPVSKDPLVRLLVAWLETRGVSVVIPAGNGDRDIDTVSAFAGAPPSWASWLDSVLPKPRMVVGGVSAVDRTRMVGSNHGTDLALCAWGDSVFTMGVGTGGGTLSAGPIFNWSGTSAASAIIAGVATLTQGLALSMGGLLSPGVLLELLRHNATTTASVEPIGVMPNLVEIAHELGYAP